MRFSLQPMLGLLSGVRRSGMRPTGRCLLHRRTRICEEMFERR